MNKLEENVKISSMNREISSKQTVSHFNDYYSNLGFNYDGKIMSRSVSSDMFSNPLNRLIILEFEGMLSHLINSVKGIKRTISFAHNKKDTNIS